VTVAATKPFVNDQLVTEALRELRRSALRCRRARVLLHTSDGTTSPVASICAAID
jgi:hypothetical protein